MEQNTLVKGKEILGRLREGLKYERDFYGSVDEFHAECLIEDVAEVVQELLNLLEKKDGPEHSST